MRIDIESLIEDVPIRDCWCGRCIRINGTESVTCACGVVWLINRPYFSSFTSERAVLIRPAGLSELDMRKARFIPGLHRLHAQGRPAPRAPRTWRRRMLKKAEIDEEKRYGGPKYSYDYWSYRDAIEHLTGLSVVNDRDRPPKCVHPETWDRAFAAAPWAYHTSWVGYKFVRDVVAFLPARPKCTVCGRKWPYWEREYRQYEWGWCSAACEITVRRQLIRSLKQEEKERKWLREARDILRQIRRMNTPKASASPIGESTHRSTSVTS